MEENKVTDISNILDVRQPISTKDIIQNIKDNFELGNVNALEGYTVIKRMAKVAEDVLKDDRIRELADKEYDKYSSETKGGKSVMMFGAQICRTATYTFYDFSGCNHPVWEALNEIEKAVKQQKELVEAELKLLIPKENASTIPGFGILDTGKTILIEKVPVLSWEDGSGEIVTVQPPKKVQKIGLKYMKL